MKEILAVGPNVNDRSRDRFYLAWHRGGVIMASSSDNGLDWSDAVQVSDDGSNIVAIPAVAPNGWVYAIWENYGTPGQGRIRFDISRDGGRTWGADSTTYFADINGFRDPASGNGRYFIPA